MKRSFRVRMAMWFSVSVVAISVVLFAVTYLHLKHELRFQTWERDYLEHHDFVTHGRYSRSEIENIAGHVIHISLLLSVPFVVIAIGIGWYLANKSLRPIADINSQLVNIQANRLNTRIHTPDADSELEEMTANINGLLSRIEESYRDMTEFSARVAHELKTPLTLMRLQLEESALSIDPEMSESLQDELMRLEGYVEQCLLIARAEQGQIEANLHPVNIKALIEDVLEPFLLLARESLRRIEFTSDSAPEVMADSWIIRQILHNLLSNSLKHGSGDILVSLTHDSRQKATVRISNSIQRGNINGTGLGLRIVEALVKSHASLSWQTFEDGVCYSSTLTWTL